MPQERYTEEEKEELRRRGIDPEALVSGATKTPTTATPVTTPKTTSSEMSTMETLGRILETGGAGAVGAGMRGGLPAAAVGGLMGVVGGAMDPTTSHEQAAASLATGPFGTASKLLPTLGRMIAGGTAAGGTRAVMTGDKKAGLATGTGTAAMEGAGSLAAPMITSLGRLGAMLKSGDIIKELRGTFGPKLAMLGGGVKGNTIEAALKRVSLAASNAALDRHAVPELETLVDNALFRGGNIARTSARIFTDPKRTRELVAVAAPEDTAKLLNHYIEENVLGQTVRSKPGSLVREAGKSPNLIERMMENIGIKSSGDYRIFNGGAATEALEKVKKSGAYESLPAVLQGRINTALEIVKRIDPTEALKSEERLGALAAKIAVSGAVRGAAGQRNVAAGVSAGLVANQLRSLTNPEVGEMIRRASQGELDAVRSLFRVLGITAAQTFVPSESQRLSVMPN